jgi:hypothetical protein
LTFVAGVDVVAVVGQPVERGPETWNGERATAL